MTKKRFKFKVFLVVEELTAVPFVTDVLFCKVRLHSGGNYSSSTSRQSVKNNSVLWQQSFEFVCKMSANRDSGILEQCFARLSVRKEVRGGRSISKIGFVDLNLAEYAGSNQKKKHCLLEGYSVKKRLNNSILKVIISMQLLSGDPLFKIPKTSNDSALSLPVESANACTSLNDNEIVDFVNPSRKSPHKLNTEVELFQVGHARHSSLVSQASKPSDCSSQHSRTPSSCSFISTSFDRKERDIISLRRASSRTSRSPSAANSFIRSSPYITKTTDNSQYRMDNTRVNADDIVNKLIDSHDFSYSTNNNDSDNLQLYVASDGSTALGGQNLSNRIESGVYQPVLFESKPSLRLKLHKT